MIPLKVGSKCINSKYNVMPTDSVQARSKLPWIKFSPQQSGPNTNRFVSPLCVQTPREWSESSHEKIPKMLAAATFSPFLLTLTSCTVKSDFLEVCLWWRFYYFTSSFWVAWDRLIMQCFLVVYSEYSKNPRLRCWKIKTIFLKKWFCQKNYHI